MGGTGAAEWSVRQAEACQQVAQARQAFEAGHTQWQEAVAAQQQEHQALVEAHTAGERQRLQRLAEAQDAFAKECSEREQAIAEANNRLDELMSGLAYGVDSAVQEYVTIVLANSAYPDGFPVSYDHSFDTSTGELNLMVSVPAPAGLPSAKAYKYSKATDEITPRR